MKKIGMLVIALALALLPLANAHAESVLLNGQKQYYTVQLRSDKRAIVYARIVFENASADKDLSTYEFSLPQGVTIDNVAAQQILAKPSSEKTCKTYETLEEWRARISNTSLYYQRDSAYGTDKLCLTWDTATKYDENFNYDTNLSGSTEYYSYSYYQTRDAKFDYSDLTQAKNGNSYTVTLSEPVKPKKQGSILVSFTTSSFVTGGFLGKYTYNVRTLLAKQMIDKTTVAVNFDNDLLTREATQQRAYTPSTDASTSIAQGTAAATYQSPSMDSLVGNVGRGGLYVKTQSSLLPGDMLSVTGVFATNSTALFLNEILIGAILLAILFIGIGLYRIWRKGHPRKHHHKKEVEQILPTSDGLGTYSAPSTATPWGRVVITSLVSVVGTIILGLALISVTLTGNASSSDSSGLMIFGFITIYLFSGIIAPALYILRYGVEVTFKWAIVHIAIIALLLLIVGGFSASTSSSHSNTTEPGYYNSNLQ